METRGTTGEETISYWFDLPIDVAEFEEKLGVGAESQDYRIIEKVLPYADEVHEHTSVYQLNELDFMYRQLSSDMQEEYVSLLTVFENLEAVFHRAFDCVSDPYETIEQCIELKIDRILTSGLENKATEGKDLIKTLIEEYGNEIEILAGSGINETNVKEFIEYTGVKQIHSSCKEWLIDKTTTMNNVSYAYHEKYDYEIVSEEKVKKLIDQCK